MALWSRPPSKVDQTIVEGPYANCLHACVASLLHAKLHELPSRSSEIDVWLADAWGLFMLTVDAQHAPLLAPAAAGVYCVGVGSRLSGAELHAVVIGPIGEHGRLPIYHDPAPDRRGLSSIGTLSFLAVR